MTIFHETDCHPGAPNCAALFLATMSVFPVSQSSLTLAIFLVFISENTGMVSFRIKPDIMKLQLPIQLVSPGAEANRKLEPCQDWTAATHRPVCPAFIVAIGQLYTCF